MLRAMTEERRLPSFLAVLAEPRAVFARAAVDSRGLGTLAGLLAFELVLVSPLGVAGSVMRAWMHPVGALAGLWGQFVSYALAPAVAILAAAVALSLWSRRRRAIDVWAAAAALGYAYVPHTLLVALGASLAAAGFDSTLLPHHPAAVTDTPLLLAMRLLLGWGPTLALAALAVHTLQNEPVVRPAPRWRRSSTSLAALALLLAGAGAAGLRISSDWRLARPLFAGDHIAHFALVGLDGATLDSRELFGQVALVDFWATWCPPCVASLPTLERLYRELGKQGFRMVSVNVEPGEEARVAAFRRQQGLSFPVYVDGGRLQQAMKVQSYPTLVLLDKTGVVRQVYVGVTSYEKLRADVLALLRSH